MDPVETQQQLLDAQSQIKHIYTMVQQLLEGQATRVSLPSSPPHAAASVMIALPD